MIKISTSTFNIDEILDDYYDNSIEKKILNILESSSTVYKYNSLDELIFELKFRKAIIEASIDLHYTSFDFKVFEEAICNPNYWRRTSEGGFLLKADVKPSDAIRDIYKNSSEYGTECSTAIVILHYKALLDVFPEKLFNIIFKRIYLMNWRALDHNLKELGYMEDVSDYIPGDRRYVKNPDVNPETPEWQGENIMDLSNGTYYGHGMGIKTVKEVIQELNKNRKKDSTVSSYLLPSVSRPNFKRLYRIYNEFMSNQRLADKKTSRGLFIRYPLDSSWYLHFKY